MKLDNWNRKRYFGLLLAAAAIVLLCVLNVGRVKLEYSTENPYPERTISNGWPVGEGKCVYSTAEKYFNNILNQKNKYEKDHRLSKLVDLDEEIGLLFSNIKDIRYFDKLDIYIGNISYFKNDTYLVDLAVENLSLWNMMTLTVKAEFTESIAQNLSELLKLRGVSVENISILGYICHKENKTFEKDVFFNNYNTKTGESDIYLDWEN